MRVEHSILYCAVVVQPQLAKLCAAAEGCQCQALRSQVTSASLRAVALYPCCRASLIVQQAPKLPAWLPAMPAACPLNEWTAGWTTHLPWADHGYLLLVCSAKGQLDHAPALGWPWVPAERLASTMWATRLCTRGRSATWPWLSCSTCRQPLAACAQSPARQAARE